MGNRTTISMLLVGCALALAGQTQADVGVKRELHRKIPAAGTSAGIGFAPPQHENAVKYRDRGDKPATGRAGGATLTVRAMLDRAGTTQLEATTGELDSSASAPGTITKLQIKALTRAGDVAYTRNFNKLNGAHHTLAFDDLSRRQGIQVQANVKGIAKSRAGVVTVEEQVKLRPDLAVENLQRPRKAYVHTGVNVAATIRERNGDLGARGNCVLSVDGKAVDRADGIWVDALGAVSCAFTHSFARSGSHQLAVAVEGVTPGDWDTSNNRAQGSIEIVEPGVPLHYYAHVYDYDQTYHYRAEQHYRRSDGSYPESPDYSAESRQQGWTQQAYIQAYHEQAKPFPFQRIAGAVRTSTGTLASIEAADVSPDWTSSYSSGSYSYQQSCAYRYSADSVSHLQVCSYRYRSGGVETRRTYVYFNRYAGDVTYHSSGYNDYWALNDGRPTYSWNYSGRTKRGTRELLDGEVTLEASFTHAGTRFAANPQLTLQPYEVDDKQPWRCHEYAYSGYALRHCYEYENRISGKRAYLQK